LSGNKLCTSQVRGGFNGGTTLPFQPQRLLASLIVSKAKGEGKGGEGRGEEPISRRLE